MIGYTMVGSNDIEKSRSYYDALFGSVGIARLTEFGPDASAWGTDWEKPMFCVTKPQNGAPATFGNGTMISIILDERAKVDAIYAKAIELGSVDEGAAGLRGDEGPQAFYGAYFRDPDGNKLCAFRMGPA